MLKRIQLRRDTTENWESINPVLASGELGVNLDTKQIKLGDGESTWNDLDYYSGVDIDLSNYVDEEYLNNVLASINIPDVSNFITAADLPDVSNFITAADLPAIPADISDLTDTQGLLNQESVSIGDITFDVTTISAPDASTISIESKAEGLVKSRLELNPEYAVAKLETISSDSTTFYSGDGLWATAYWIVSPYGYGELVFTGAEQLYAYFDSSTNEWNNGENKKLGWNGGTLIEFNGWGYGGGELRITLSQTDIPPVDPTDVTELNLAWDNISRIAIDSNDYKELQINARGMNIEINSSIDVNIEAGDDLRLTGSDTVSIRNKATDEPISIVTDYNNNEYTWEFGFDGSLKFPDNTSQTTAWTGKIEKAGSLLQINDAGNLEFIANESVLFTVQQDTVVKVNQQVQIGTDETAFSTIGHTDGVGLEINTLNNDSVSLNIVKDGVGEDPGSLLFLKFNSDGTLTLEDLINSKFTRFINLDELKTVVAESTDFADFQTRIANIT